MMISGTGTSFRRDDDDGDPLMGNSRDERLQSRFSSSRSALPPLNSRDKQFSMQIRLRFRIFIRHAASARHVAPLRTTQWLKY